MDILRRIFAIVFPWVGLAAMGWYMYNGVATTWLPQPYSYIVIWLTAIVLLGVLVVFGVLALPVSRAKIRSIIAWLVVILLWFRFFQNDIDSALYIGDILVVVGAFITYLSLWGLIVSKKAQEKLKESKQIIIEV